MLDVRFNIVCVVSIYSTSFQKVLPNKPESIKSEFPALNCSGNADVQRGLTTTFPKGVKEADTLLGDSC